MMINIFNFFVGFFFSFINIFTRPVFETKLGRPLYYREKVALFSPLNRSIYTISLECPGEGSNLHTFRHVLLRHACIPISPPGLVAIRDVLSIKSQRIRDFLTSTLQSLLLRKNLYPEYSRGTTFKSRYRFFL